MGWLKSLLRQSEKKSEEEIKSIADSRNISESIRILTKYYDCIGRSSAVPDEESCQDFYFTLKKVSTLLMFSVLIFVVIFLAISFAWRSLSSIYSRIAQYFSIAEIIVALELAQCTRTRTQEVRRQIFA